MKSDGERFSMLYYLKRDCKMKQAFNLSKEQKENMIYLLQGYFKDEQGEEIGNLQAMLLLDFIIDKLAPEFYNLGVEDSHQYLTEKMDDIFEIQKK